MTPRLNPFAFPHLMQPLLDLGQAAIAQGLEPTIIHLVEIRASQINGCAICLDMHTRAARQAGESEERIFMLDAWRESPLYTDRERAALAWTEALTRLAETRAPDEDYELVKAQFSEEDQVKLTLMVSVINAFNRFGVGFRRPPLSHAQRAAA